MTQQTEAPPETGVEKGEADEFKPPATDLVVRDPLDEQEVYRVLDRHDEALIMDEIQGRALDVMLYDFTTRDGRRNTDLSYAGVLEAIRILNARGATRARIAPTPTPQVQDVMVDDETHVQVLVYGEDPKNGGGQWGLASQPRHFKKRNGDLVQDVFAYTKALSKAQRNALKGFIPAELRAMLIAQFLKQPEAVKRIQAGAGAAEIAELPPPLTTPEAQEVRDRIRKTYRQVRDIHPTQFILPGQFNALMLRHEWSMDRLAELEQHIDGLLEKAQGWKAEQEGGKS